MFFKKIITNQDTFWRKYSLQEKLYGKNQIFILDHNTYLVASLEKPNHLFHMVSVEPLHQIPNRVVLSIITRAMTAILSDLIVYLDISKNSRTDVTSRKSHSKNIFRDVRQIQIKSSFLERKLRAKKR